MKSVKQAQTKTPVVVGSVMWKQGDITFKCMIYNNNKEAHYELVRGVPVSHFM
jgi:hypothetical protein